MWMMMMMRVRRVRMVVRGYWGVIHHRNKIGFWTGPSAAACMVLMMVLMLVVPIGGFCIMHIFLF
jgi:hypothetical protein